jgi:hypothetical protein
MIGNQTLQLKYARRISGITFIGYAQSKKIGMPKLATITCIKFSEFYQDALKRRRVGIPLTGLTPPHFDACLNPGFPTLYVMLVFLFNCLR